MNQFFFEQAVGRKYSLFSTETFLRKDLAILIVTCRCTGFDQASCFPSVNPQIFLGRAILLRNQQQNEVYCQQLSINYLKKQTRKKKGVASPQKNFQVCKIKSCF